MWRVAGLGLVGAVSFVCGAIGVTFGQPPREPVGRYVYEYPGQQGYSAEPAPAPTLPSEPQRPADAEEYKKPCDRPGTPVNDDLCQQWRMAEAAEELTRLTARQIDFAQRQLTATQIEIGALIAAVFCALGTAVIAIKANKLNREALIADQRAWMQLDQIEVQSDLTWQDGAGRVEVYFRLRNIGRTPAFSVWLKAMIWLGVHIQAKSVYIENENWLRRRDWSDVGSVIFPNKVYERRDILSISREDIAKFRNENDGRESLNLTLIGCLDYTISFDVERRHTGFIFAILRETEDGRFNLIGPEFGDIPADELRLWWERILAE